MSNNNQFWGRRFGFYEPRTFSGNTPFGNCLGISGFGASPRTNHSNPNKPQSKQSRLDKARFEAYVKKHGRPVIYFKSNGVKDAEKTRNLSPSITSIPYSES